MPQLKPGDRAPLFETVDQNGEPVRLDDFAHRKIFMYFYPKANTSG